MVAAHGKFLSPEQNEKAREHLRDLLRQHAGNQSKVAPLLGVSQPTLSAFLSGRQGTSYGFAARLASLLDLSIDAVLGESPAPPASGRRRLRDRPEWGEVVAQAHRDRPYLPDDAFEMAGAFVDELPTAPLDALFTGDLAQALFAFDSRRRASVRRGSSPA